MPKEREAASIAREGYEPRTATRYKIDSAKLTTAIRAELSKAKIKPKDGTKRAKDQASSTKPRA